MTIKGITIKWPVWMLLLIGLGVAAYFIGPKFMSTKRNKVALNGWSGFAPEIKMNEGMLYTPDCRNFKEFNLKVDFIQIEDRATAISALVAKEVDAIWTTTDIMSTEVGAGSNLTKIGIAQILQIDRSNGADVIVGDRTIKNVMDAKGQKVAYTPASASHTLLLNWLKSGGLTMKDIIPVPVVSGTKAAEMFNSRDVKIAVTWSPDDGGCYKAIEGSHELFSTAKAKNIVMDGLIVRKDDLKDKKMREFFVKLAKSWMVANGECNNSDQKKREAATCFAKNFNVPEDVVLDGLNKVRLSTYQDNKNFFGLNVSFRGVTGDDLYSRMADIYSTVPDEKGAMLANNPLSWKEVSDASIIQEITDLTGSDQAAEPDVVKFDPIPKEKEKAVQDAVALTAVKITVNFAVGSAELDDDARTIIDREVAPYLKGFSGYRIRVEGNTDKTGNPQKNIELSFRRANATIKYLIDTYHFDPNRFTKPIGWGSKNPIYANESSDSERAANRRTEFSFINE